jgi:hypothetical protein
MAPRVQVWFNGFWTVFWLIMMCLTPVFAHTLYAAVVWVSFISAWALFATHLGAWIAALVNVRAEDLQGHAETVNERHDEMHAKLDHIIRHSEDIPDFHES